jgi:DNA modification methylase
MSTMQRPTTPLTGPYARPIRVPRNRVAQGDCAHVRKRLPDDAVDLVLTDPPYICRYQSRDGRRVANDDNDNGFSRRSERCIAC